MSFFRNRLPPFQQVVPVFSVVSMMFFGWTAFRFSQKIPSFLLYLQPGEIISVYSYALVTNFFESLIYILAVAMVSFILPRRWFGERFVAGGALFSMLGIGYLMYLAAVIGQGKSMEFPWEAVVWAPAWALAILSVSVVLPLFVPVKSAIESFADRAIIFLYILMPLSAVGAVIVVINQLR